MVYLKKRLDEEGVDSMRVNLAMRKLKLSAEPVCDFCGDPQPTFVYASYKMSTGETAQCWRWCACEACSQAIDSDDFVTVETRMLRRFNAMSPPIIKGSPLVVSALRLALDEFHRHVIRGSDEKMGG